VYLKDGCILFGLGWNKADAQRVAKHIVVHIADPLTSALFVVYQGVVRPFYDTVAHHCCPGAVEVSVNLAFVQRGVGVDEKWVLSCFRSNSERCIGVPIGWQTWRHAAVALGRLHVKGATVWSDLDDDIYHRQAGHSAATAAVRISAG
jgi:hypothetical protein